MTESLPKRTLNLPYFDSSISKPIISFCKPSLNHFCLLCSFQFSVFLAVMAAHRSVLARGTYNILSSLFEIFIISQGWQRAVAPVESTRTTRKLNNCKPTRKINPSLTVGLRAESSGLEKNLGHINQNMAKMSSLLERMCSSEQQNLAASENSPPAKRPPKRKSPDSFDELSQSEDDCSPPRKRFEDCNSDDNVSLYADEIWIMIHR